MAGLQSVEVFDRRCNCIRIREPDILRKMYRPLLRLRGFIAALLVAVLVIMPVADAFVCSFEVDTHAASDHAGPAPPDEAGEGDAPDSAHGGCVHNHCHHSTANFFGSAAVVYPAAHVVQHAQHDPSRASALSEGPMRPPQS